MAQRVTGCSEVRFSRLRGGASGLELVQRTRYRVRIRQNLERKDIKCSGALRLARLRRVVLASLLEQYLTDLSLLLCT